jgi:O-antigen/teichoic acid export membrane protein
MRGRGHAAAGTVAEVVAWLWLAPALAILVPLWGVNGVAAALSGSYALSLAALLILAMARGEMPYGTILAVGPRAAWNRLRILSEARSSS